MKKIFLLITVFMVLMMGSAMAKDNLVYLQDGDNGKHYIVKESIRYRHPNAYTNGFDAELCVALNDKGKDDMRRFFNTEKEPIMLTMVIEYRMVGPAKGDHKFYVTIKEQSILTQDGDFIQNFNAITRDISRDAFWLQEMILACQVYQGKRG